MGGGRGLPKPPLPCSRDAPRRRGNVQPAPPTARTRTNSTDQRKPPKSDQGRSRASAEPGPPPGAVAPAPDPSPAPADLTPAGERSQPPPGPPRGSQERVREGQQVLSTRLGTSQSLVLRAEEPERQARDPACHPRQRFSVQGGGSVLAAPTSRPIQIYLCAYPEGSGEDGGEGRKKGTKQNKKKENEETKHRDSKCSEIVFGCHQTCGRVPGSPGRVQGAGPGPRGVLQT